MKTNVRGYYLNNKFSTILWKCFKQRQRKLFASIIFECGLPIAVIFLLSFMNRQAKSDIRTAKNAVDLYVDLAECYPSAPLISAGILDWFQGALCSDSDFQFWQRNCKFKEAEEMNYVEQILKKITRPSVYAYPTFAVDRFIEIFCGQENRARHLLRHWPRQEKVEYNCKFAKTVLDGFSLKNVLNVFETTFYYYPTNSKVREIINSTENIFRNMIVLKEISKIWRESYSKNISNYIGKYEMGTIIDDFVVKCKADVIKKCKEEITYACKRRLDKCNSLEKYLPKLGNWATLFEVIDVAFMIAESVIDCINFPNFFHADSEEDLHHKIVNTEKSIGIIIYGLNSSTTANNVGHIKVEFVKHYIEDYYKKSYGNNYYYARTDTSLVVLYELISRSIMEIVSNQSYSQGITLQEMLKPCEKYQPDFKLTVKILQNAIEFLIIICWMPSFCSLVISIVTEKEKRLTFTLTLMSVARIEIWFSWFLYVFPMYVFVSLATIFLFDVYSVFEYSSLLLIFNIFLLYSIVCILQGFLVTTLFNTSRLASIASPLVYLFGTIIRFFLNADTPAFVLWLVSIIPQSAFYISLKTIFHFEALEVGLTWHTIHTRWEFNSTGFEIIVTMFFTGFLYMVIILYIEAVFPGEYGVAKVWYFPVTKQFWFQRKMKGMKQKSANQPLPPESIYFERDPEHLKIGIQVIELFKKYHSNGPTVVNGLTLNFYVNQITAFLGHNGAGKTTTLSIIAGIFPQTSGKVIIDGYNTQTSPEYALESLGLCPQHNVLFDYLTVEEHIKLYGGLKSKYTKDNTPEGRKDILDKLNLYDKRNALVTALSGGMKRRLSVGLAFLGNPRAVILDEPTAGVDPYARREIWDVILANKKGRAIILTTHHMDEADILGDRIAILSRGKLQCCGTSMFLKRALQKGYLLNLCLSSKHDGDASKLEEYINSYVPNSKLIKQAIDELTFELPQSACDTGEFEKLFKNLEKDKETLHVENYGLNSTPLESIFLDFIDEKPSVEEYDEDNEDNEDEESSIIDLGNLLGGQLFSDDPITVIPPDIPGINEYSHLQIEPLTNTNISNTSTISKATNVFSFRSKKDKTKDLKNMITSSYERIYPLCDTHETVTRMQSEDSLGFNMTTIPFTETAYDFNKKTNQTTEATIQTRKSKLFSVTETRHDSNIPNITDSNIDSYEYGGHINEPKASGPFLWLMHFYSTVVKRAIFSVRGKASICGQYIIPFVLLIAAMVLYAKYIKARPIFEELAYRVKEYLPWNLLANESELHVFFSNENPLNPVAKKYEAMIQTPLGLGGVRCMNPRIYSLPKYPCKTWLVQPSWTPFRTPKNNTERCKTKMYPLLTDWPVRTQLHTTDYLYKVPREATAIWLLEPDRRIKDIRFGGFNFGSKVHFLEEYGQIEVVAFFKEIFHLKIDDRTPVPKSIFWDKLESFLKKGGASTHTNTLIWHRNMNGTFDEAISYLGILINIMYREKLPNQSDTGISLFINQTKKVFADKGINKYRTWFTSGVYTLIKQAFTLSICSVLIFLVDERVSVSKYLQIISGLQPVTYWIGNFAWDMCNSLILIGMTLCLLRMVEWWEYVAVAQIGTFTGFLILFSATSLIMMYVLSHWSSSPGKYLLLVFITIELVTGLTEIFVRISDSYPKMKGGYVRKRNSIDKLAYFFQIIMVGIPHYNFGRGLSNIFAFYDNETHNEKRPTTLWISIQSESYMILGCFFVYSFLLIFLEYSPISFENVLSIYYRKFKLAGQEALTDEADVNEEKERIINDTQKTDAVQLINITKIYSKNICNNFTAVKSMHLGIRPGECFGLLGVNGAGKTTTFKMMTGEITPTAGKILIEGINVELHKHKALKNVGYCPQFNGFGEKFTSREVLRLHARINGIYEKVVESVVTYYMDSLGLLQHADKLSGDLSGGNKRKLSTCIALIGNPDIVFLDEPTSGMDTAARRELWDCIISIVARGICVVLTSHSLEEAEVLCQRACIMVSGRLRCLGSIQYLKLKFGSGYTVTLRSNKGEKNVIALKAYMTKMEQAVLSADHGQYLEYQMPFSVPLSKVFQMLQAVKLKRKLIEDYSINQTTLDDIFIDFARDNENV